MKTASIHISGLKGIPLGESRLWAVGIREVLELPNLRSKDELSFERDLLPGLCGLPETEWDRKAQGRPLTARACGSSCQGFMLRHKTSEYPDSGWRILPIDENVDITVASIKDILAKHVLR